MSTATEFWEDFYATGRARWSGAPNRSLVDEVAGLAPGSALDLGCGQGGDAIWLAGQGWTVTAVDVSATALEAAERNAAEAGVTITWERHELGASFPAGMFDLVASTFLHSPVPLPRVEILRAAAAAVAPGGTLLVIGHAPSEAHHKHDLPGPEQVLADLALPTGTWQVPTCELRDLEHAFRDEDPHQRVDSVLRVQRR
jgi:2-polyprenyl-3-methyl-5-hydroxy-6-metoxy-1,4-benzoquinol methylase